MDKICTREEILNVIDWEIKKVKIAEWKGIVCIRTFDGVTRAQLLQPTKEVPSDWMEQVIVASVCDDKGKTLFTKDDIPALSKKNSAVLDRIFTEAIKLNGLSDHLINNYCYQINTVISFSKQSYLIFYQKFFLCIFNDKFCYCINRFKYCYIFISNGNTKFIAKSNNQFQRIN